MSVKLQIVDGYRWLIPQEGKMRAPGLVFASQAMVVDIQKDKSPE